MSDKQFHLTFKEAIDMGKYQEDFLSQYDEWKHMDDQVRFQYITQALKNRARQLRVQWAALNNQLDFSAKPELKVAQQKVERAMKEMKADQERMLIEYAGV